MSPLFDTVSALIQNSETLKEKPEEMWYWQVMSKQMTDAQLEKLKTVLDEEARSIERIRAEEADHLAKIDEDHLRALQEFKTVTLPKFRKEWEEASRKAENVENILQSIDDGNA